MEILQKCYMAYYLNETHILIRGNIHENFKTFSELFCNFYSFLKFYLKIMMSSQCIWCQILTFSFIVFLKIWSLFLQIFIVRDILVQKLRRLGGEDGGGGEWGWGNNWPSPKNLAESLKPLVLLGLKKVKCKETICWKLTTNVCDTKCTQIIWMCSSIVWDRVFKSKRFSIID